ncbi:MAG: Uma2 family endonuclease, partial [Leptolyngbyaceae cyanobacterium]
EILFADQPDVFVAGDLLWYPVQGDNTTRQAPDALVVFGRPKGVCRRHGKAKRGSYQQWKEEDIPPQVVFEILSPGNRPSEMMRKFKFYERHGVEEYYIYDPDDLELTGWIRRNSHLSLVAEMNGWVSPQLQIRFVMDRGKLEIYRPDGRKFLTPVELEQRATAAEEKATAAEEKASAAEDRAKTAEELLEKYRDRFGPIE